MALQSIIGWFRWPPIPTAASLSFTIGNNVIDASGEKYAFVFMAPKTGTLERVGIGIGTVSSAQDLKVSFQNVSATTGDPDETVDEFRVIASGSLSSLSMVETGIMSDDGTDTGVKRSVTVGDIIAVVVEFNATVGNLGITDHSDDAAEFPYGSHKTGGSWSKNQRAPVLAIKYTDGYVATPGLNPINSVGTRTFNSGSTPDEIGLLFNVPFKSRAAGAWVWADLDGDASIILYDSDGSTPLATVALDKDNRASTNSRLLFVPFAGVTLNANTNYRLTLRPDSATNCGMEYFNVLSASIMDCFPGGQNIHRTHRTDADSWTQTTTERPMMGLLIDQVSDDVGGGGSETFTGTKMNRGFN